MPSIRMRLLLTLLTFFVMVWGWMVLVALHNTYHEVEELFDAQLAQSARVLFSLVQEQERITLPDAASTKATLAGHRYERNISFQIWRGEQVLLQSDSASRMPLAPKAGFHDQIIHGEKWRVFLLADPETPLAVQVGEKSAVRDELTYEVTEHSLHPMLIFLPSLAVLIWIGVGRGLHPLQRVASEVERRSPHQMAPVALEQVPREVAPLVESINHLLARLDNALTAERRFTADAAHELRTPLASLKIQAQVALRAHEAAMLRQTLHQIVAGVDRATHLVEQLLTLARLDPEVAMEREESADLRTLTEIVLAELAPIALDKEIEISLNAPENDHPAKSTWYHLQGNPAALAVLVRNLVDNAIRYTPCGGIVEVILNREEDHLILEVNDSGPGIPPTEREHLFQRFRRGKNKDAHGCGLGLSIVRRIVELHQGEVTLATAPQGGLQTRVTLPIQSGPD